MTNRQNSDDNRAPPEMTEEKRKELERMRKQVDEGAFPSNASWTTPPKKDPPAPVAPVKKQVLERRAFNGRIEVNF